MSIPLMWCILAYQITAPLTLAHLPDAITHLLKKFTSKCPLTEYSTFFRVVSLSSLFLLHINFQVRAAESLMKLVADVKQYLILNDFPSVNEAITQNSQIFKTKSQEADQKLMALRDDMASDLYELEEEFYSSIYKEK